MKLTYLDNRFQSGFFFQFFGFENLAKFSKSLYHHIVKISPTKTKKKTSASSRSSKYCSFWKLLLPSLTYSQIGLIQLVNHLKCGDITKLETSPALDIPATNCLNWTAFRWHNHLSDLSLTRTKRNVPIKFGHQIGVQKSFASWPNNFQPAHGSSFKCFTWVAQGFEGQVHFLKVLVVVKPFCRTCLNCFYASKVKRAEAPKLP